VSTDLNLVPGAAGPVFMTLPADGNDYRDLAEELTLRFPSDTLQDPAVQQRGLTWLNEHDEQLAWCAQAMAAAARTAGAVVVRDFPVHSDSVLVVTLAALGTIQGNNGVSSGFIEAVTPNESIGRGTAFSKTQVFSRQRGELTLHSDQALIPRPYRYLCLACVTATPDAGGESMLMSADQIVSTLSLHGHPSDIALLEQPVFPFKSVSIDPPVTYTAPIIEREASGHYLIRYQSWSLDNGLRSGSDGLTPLHHAALGRLSALLLEPGHHATFTLRPGDMFVFDNRRMLHGRTEIAPGTDRYLKRIKIKA
jgi:alpha-ketoglutarate-dependent taurine dioxygenase